MPAKVNLSSGSAVRRNNESSTTNRCEKADKMLSLSSPWNDKVLALPTLTSFCANAALPHKRRMMTHKKLYVFSFLM